jgi:hypothetical protein
VFFKAAKSRFRGSAKARFGELFLAFKMRIFRSAAPPEAVENGRLPENCAVP